MKHIVTITVHYEQNENKRTHLLTPNQVLRQEGLSQALRRKLRQQGLLFVNKEEANWQRRLEEGDQLEVFLKKERTLTAYALPLNILYEDDHLLAINKPAGLLMHPTSSERHKTLANAIEAHYLKKNEPWDFHPIHRLDKDTSGIVLIAKSAYVQHEFNKIKTHRCKTYYALVEGFFPSVEAHVHLPIGRKEGSIIERTISFTKDESPWKGQKAYTEFHRLKGNEQVSILEVKLHTGRTHQIRVHATALGHPLLGDDLYGGSVTYMKRQALHAHSITFSHPIEHKELTITAPLPEDMAQVLEKLRTEPPYLK